MSDTELECLALDGSTIRLWGSSSLSPRGYSSEGVAELRSLGIRSQNYAAGPLSFGQEMALSPHLSRGFQFTHEYGLQGGRLRLGSGFQHPEPDGSEYLELGPDGRLRPAKFNMAVWEGERYSLQTFNYGGEATSLIPVLDVMVITEKPSGIVCRPRDPRQTAYWDGPRILQDVPGVALLDIKQLTNARVRNLPMHRGTSVPGGELFASEHIADKHYYFILAGQTCITYIMPHTGDADTVLASLEELEVSWTI